jgi:hypothetical protein
MLGGSETAAPIGDDGSVGKGAVADRGDIGKDAIVVKGVRTKGSPTEVLNKMLLKDQSINRLCLVSQLCLRTTAVDPSRGVRRNLQGMEIPEGNLMSSVTDWEMTALLEPSNSQRVLGVMDSLYISFLLVYIYFPFSLFFIFYLCKTTTADCALRTVHLYFLL